MGRSAAPPCRFATSAPAHIRSLPRISFTRTARLNRLSAENDAMETAAATCRVIVVGGSAGALDGLIQLLTLAPDLTSPTVVVLHLARQRQSQLPSVLTANVGRTVVEAEDKMPLEPAGIYVAPPDYHLLIDTGPALALS